VEDVLGDIWGRISKEFPANPAKDVVMWHEREPEFTLQNRRGLGVLLFNLNGETSVGYQVPGQFSHPGSPILHWLGIYAHLMLTGTQDSYLMPVEL
jgi:hypothetical protein